jgi:DNA-binding beta-propeller fold protein YncE
MARPHALLRAGFPYLKTLGMRRVTSNPVDVAIGGDNRLYVLCRSTIQTEIRRYTFEDDDLGPVSGPGTAEGKLLWPAALIVDREENLYVSDEACHRVSAFSRDGELLRCWGEHGRGDGQLDRPSGLAFDPDGNIYVSDTMNHRIQRFTSEGRFLAKWGVYGDGDGELNMPWGLHVDEQGDVYVADWRNDRIQKFTPDGELILSFGASGSGDGQFNRPSGVASDPDGDIYVADWGNDRVQLFSHEGRYVDKFIGDATLSRSARQYVLANALTLRLRETARLEPQKRLRGPISVRVDSNGRMYIPDYGSHRIQVYQKESYPLKPDQLSDVPRSPTLLTA